MRNPNLFTLVRDRLNGATGPDKGGWFTAFCPFHNDRQRPNLRFNERGFRCMACDEAGNIGELAARLGVETRRRFEDRVVAAYDYRDERGALLFQSVRLRDPKGFRLRRPDGRGGWFWNAKGVRLVPYRLPEVLSAAPDQALFVVEGEKDADRLWAEGIPATTNPMGAGKWRDEYTELLRGRTVAIIPDNDEPGHRHAEQVARSLHGVADEVRILELPDLPEKGDVSDWFDAGGTADALRQLAGAAHPAVEPFERPQIVITNRHLHEISADGWSALLAGNSPPRLFQHGGAIAEIGRDDDDRARISHVTMAGLRGRLDRAAVWVRLTEDGPKPARPPKDVVEDIDAMPKPLPVLRGIVGTPIFSSSGTLSSACGYQDSTRLFYEASGEPVPPIPPRPDDTDVRRAKQLIFQDWLADFPFVDDASQVNLLAAVVTAVARELIDGPSPLFAIDAPTPGTGKGLLASGVGIITTGNEPAVMSEPRGDDELRKRVTALLSEGVPAVLLDNIKRPLRSGVLAALLTATTWSDRILGRTQTTTLPVRAVWLATGNNLQLDGEIARRTVWIRLDSRRDRPWERTGFQHARLIPWLRRHRHDLVWAFLVLVQHWIARGRPAWTGRPLGSYEAWCDVVGGVFEAAGIKGFLGNREELYRRTDAETEEWRSFTNWWWGRHGDDPVKAAELRTPAQEFLITLFEKVKDGTSDRAIATRLGKALAERRDQRLANLFIRRAGDDSHNGGALWQLEPAPPDVAVADVETASAPTSAQHPQANGPFPDSIADDADIADMVSRVDLTFPPNQRLAEESDATAFSYPHVPQHPQTDSDPLQIPADVVRKMPRQVADVPPCKRCGGARETSTSNLCDDCRADALRRVMKGQV